MTLKARLDELEGRRGTFVTPRPPHTWQTHDLLQCLDDTLQLARDLYAENERLLPDAERYRFLRDNEDFQIEYTGHLTLDQHVDEGMRAAQPPEGG